MVELRLFGGLEILGIDPERARTLMAQPRRVALLAYLGSRPRQALERRDRLAAMFWPDADPSAARLSLRQAVSFIRKAIGDDALVAGGDARGEEEIGVDPRVVRCDVAEFEQLAASGELARAAELYRGDLLAGFPPTGVHAFERYRDERGEALLAQAREVMCTLGERAAGAGNRELATHWARRALALDPAHEDAVGRAMRTFVAAGNPASALDAYESYARIATQELEEAPAAELTRLASEIRGSLAAADPMSCITEPPPPPPPPVLPRRIPRLARPATIGTALLVLAAASIALAMRARSASTPASARTATLEIAPFTAPTGAAALEAIGTGVAKLLAARLDGEPGWALVDREAAERLSGTVVQSGSTLTVAAVLRAGRGDSILLSVDATAPVDSLMVIADRIAAALLLHRAGYATTETERYARRELPVLREFLRGQVAMRAGRHEDAMRAFDTALAGDSTFAEAALYLGAAGRQTGAWRPWRRGLELAVARRGELGRTDALYLAALTGPQWPDASTHAQELDAWDRFANFVPDRADGWCELGDLLLRWGPVMGLPDHRTRAKAALVRALELSPGAADPVMPLVEIAIAEGDTATVLRLREAYVARDRAGEAGDYLRWRIAHFLGDRQALAALRGRFDALPFRTLLHIIGMAQVDDVGMDDAARAVTLLRRAAASAHAQATATVVLTHWELNRGHAEAAAREHRDNSLSNPRDAILHALYGGGDSLFARRAVADMMAPRAAARVPAGNAGPPAVARTRGDNACRLAQWRLWRHEPVDVPAAVAVMRGTRRPEHANCAVLVTTIDAVLHARSDARMWLDSLDATLRIGDATAGNDTYGEIALARLRLLRGEREEALRVVRRRPYHHWWGPWYLGPSRQLEREILRQDAGPSAAGRAPDAPRAPSRGAAAADSGPGALPTATAAPRSRSAPPLTRTPAPSP